MGDNLKNVKKRTRKDTNLRSYKITAAAILLCGCGAWKLQNGEWERIQAAEMKYLRNVKSCTRTNQLRAENM
jgi:hypothetical protein